MFKNLYRLLKKYSLLALRSNNTPHHIALGVAIGLCCGVAIPIGQMLLAILLVNLRYFIAKERYDSSLS